MLKNLLDNVACLEHIDQCGASYNSFCKDCNTFEHCDGCNESSAGSIIDLSTAQSTRCVTAGRVISLIGACVRNGVLQGMLGSRAKAS
jgi:hypothetical protein